MVRESAFAGQVLTPLTLPCGGDVLPPAKFPKGGTESPAVSPSLVTARQEEELFGPLLALPLGNRLSGHRGH